MVQSFPSKPPPRTWTCGRSKEKLRVRTRGRMSWLDRCRESAKLATMLVGQGSLNQPLNESDLIRERVGSNIGETGDEQVARLAINQHIVVTISADTPIYMVLEQSPKSNQVSVQRSARRVPTSNSANIEQLRQLLQLQQELNQSSTSDQATQ